MTRESIILFCQCCLKDQKCYLQFFLLKTRLFSSWCQVMLDPPRVSKEEEPLVIASANFLQFGCPPLFAYICHPANGVKALQNLKYCE